MFKALSYYSVNRPSTEKNIIFSYIFKSTYSRISSWFHENELTRFGGWYLSIWFFINALQNNKCKYLILSEVSYLKRLFIQHHSWDPSFIFTTGEQTESQTQILECAMLMFIWFTRLQSLQENWVKVELPHQVSNLLLHAAFLRLSRFLHPFWSKKQKSHSSLFARCSYPWENSFCPSPSTVSFLREKEIKLHRSASSSISPSGKAPEVSASSYMLKFLSFLQFIWLYLLRPIS